jgi:hypothetical protein
LTKSQKRAFLAEKLTAFTCLERDSAVLYSASAAHQTGAPSLSLHDFFDQSLTQLAYPIGYLLRKVLNELLHKPAGVFGWIDNQRSEIHAEG